MSLKTRYLAGGIAAFTLLGIGTLAMSGETGSGPAGAAPAAASAFPLELAKMKHLGIRLVPAEAAAQVPLASLPATIVPPPNARVAVAPLFPGIVIRTNVVEGDHVVKGQALAVVSSRDVLVMGADLARAQARLGVAKSSADRLSQLGREGIVAGARVEEAQASYREASVDASEKARILRMAGAAGGSGTYVLTAPISGRVSKAAIQAGNPVDGSSAAYVIDAAGRYEIEAQLPERLASLAKPGMRIRLDDGVEGEVTAVGSTIDPLTRSVTLKASLPLGPGLIAGRATTVTLYQQAPQGVVTVPSAAVTTIEGKPVVFAQSGGKIVLRKVRTGGNGNGRTVLTEGVKPGEKVVVTGTSELKVLATAS